jgi:hypothetical protein
LPSGLDVKAAPGATGYSNAYLRVLCLEASFSHPDAHHAVAAMRAYALLYANCDLPPWYYWVSTAVREIGLAKPDSGTRPIGIGCRLRVCVTRCVFTQAMRKAIGMEVAPSQVAVGVPAGISRTIAGMAMHIREDSQGAAIRNAYNELERSAVIPALLASTDPAIRSLARAAVALLCPVSPVLLGSGPSRVCAPFVSVQGVQQGSVEGMPFFCLALHSVLAVLPNPHGVVVSAIADDVTLAGKPAATCDLLPVLAALLRQELNLEAQPHKSEYAAHEDAAGEMAREVQRACPSIPCGAAMRSPPYGGQQMQEFGIVRGSIPIGTPGFVRGYLNEVVYPRVERDAVAVQDSLGSAYPQQRWLMLYHSTQYMIDYWLQHCAPEDTLELATAFDALILRPELCGGRAWHRSPASANQDGGSWPAVAR